jgi:hypothetical protein
MSSWAVLSNLIMPKNKGIIADYKKYITFAPGEMAEWSIAAVLKTVELRGSGGSNPSLSAKKIEAQRSWAFLFCTPGMQTCLLIPGVQNKKQPYHCFNFFEQPPPLGITERSGVIPKGCTQNSTK